VKSGAAVTTKVTVVECTREPLVPVSVRVELLAGVFVEVVTLRVDVPEPDTDVGLKLPLAALGKPDALRVTVPLNPPEAEIVTVYVVDCPWFTDREEGDALIVKSPAARSTLGANILAMQAVNTKDAHFVALQLLCVATVNA
jgi:hypothetical protein